MKKIFIIGVSKGRVVLNMTILSVLVRRNTGSRMKCHYCNGLLELKQPGIDHVLFACGDCKPDERQKIN